MRKFKLDEFIKYMDSVSYGHKVTINIPMIRFSGVVHGWASDCGFLQLYGVAHGYNHRGHRIDYSHQLFIVDLKNMKKNYKYDNIQVVLDYEASD